jgi:hypothetical protein
LDSLPAQTAFDDLIAQAHSLGLRLNNLFELPNGVWQANLTDGTKFWGFGRAGTWQSALRQALAIAQTTEGETELDQGAQIEFKTRARPGPTGKTTSSAATPEDLGL